MNYTHIDIECPDSLVDDFLNCIKDFNNTHTVDLNYKKINSIDYSSEEAWQRKTIENILKLHPDAVCNPSGRTIYYEYKNPDNGTKKWNIYSPL